MYLLGRRGFGEIEVGCGECGPSPATDLPTSAGSLRGQGGQFLVLDQHPPQSQGGLRHLAAGPDQWRAHPGRQVIQG